MKANRVTRGKIQTGETKDFSKRCGAGMRIAGAQLIGSNQIGPLQVMAQQGVFNGGHDHSQHGGVSCSGDVDVNLSLLRIGFLSQSSEPALEVIAASPRVTRFTFVIREKVLDR